MVSLRVLNVDIRVSLRTIYVHVCCRVHFIIRLRFLALTVNS